MIRDYLPPTILISYDPLILSATLCYYVLDLQLSCTVCSYLLLFGNILHHLILPLLATLLLYVTTCLYPIPSNIICCSPVQIANTCYLLFLPPSDTTVFFNFPLLPLLAAIICYPTLSATATICYYLR